MSAHILRHFPAAKRATSCICYVPRRLYAAQAALQPRPDFEHEHQPTTSHADVESASASASRSRRVKPGFSKTQKGGDAPSTSRDPLEPTGVDRYLARLNSEGVEPTLEDLDKCRPARQPSKLSNSYVAKYNELLDTVCRCFSRAQLKKFVQLSGLEGKCRGRAPKKIEFAEAIIEERWGWPSLAEVEKEKRDRTEVVAESFPVTPSQLFVIMGKDGVDLLKLSMKHNVHISLISQPLALHIEGVRGRMRRMLEELHNLTKNIVEDIMQLPTRTAIRPDLVQRISRLANAYMENIGDQGLVRICARDTHSLGSAKRLASRASGEVISASQVPLVSYLPADVPLTSQVPDVISPYTYALYPFLSPRALPWYMNTAGAFRVRRVGEWLIKSKGEDLEKTGGLTHGKLLNLKGEPLDLRETLFTSEPAPGRQRRIKASTGHILFNTQSKEQHATLMPPLRDSHQFADILNWISEQKQNVRPSFISGLPPSLVHSPPSEQRLVHRLIYKALPQADSTGNLIRKEIITLELVMAQPQAQSKSSEQESQTELEAEVDTSSQLSVEPVCERGTESQLNLMMPDRAMDLRLSGLETELLSEQSQPAELKQYVSDLRDFLNGQSITQPDPPLTILPDGETYILHTSATIRQSVEQLPRGHDMWTAASHGLNAPLNVVSESRLDLESGQRTTACEITCANPTSELNWNEFLMGCDALSIARYRAPSTIPLEATSSAEI